jgi:uncharacterized protein (TIGR02453 family)
MIMNFETAFRFLKKLRTNNNRDWFEKNKPAFLEIKASFENFISDLIQEAVAFDTSLGGQDPKKLVFRIYRDVRFSKDKRPYKDYISAGLSEAGKGTGVPGYYLQLQPGDKSFLCIGLYAPSPENLGRIRQEIDYNGEELALFFANKSFQKFFAGFWAGDALKTAPKGYPKDHQFIAWLKQKHFVIMHSFSDDEVLQRGFMKKVLTVMRVGKPLNDFLRKAMD